MNRDEILAIAEESGFIVDRRISTIIVGIPMSTGQSLQDLLDNFASRIESLVREEAAKECDLWAEKAELEKTGKNDLADLFLGHHIAAARSCAAAIRKSEG